ncbi:interference hedgehog [Bactrocera tryoni]|uniref:interference hedgehog n=1 Tax=Bactrocera tryoni TaxID=59916 RepID=UPI001A977253|nr:interference hedgehog [Bactrocera tryoni]
MKLYPTTMSTRRLGCARQMTCAAALLLCRALVIIALSERLLAVGAGSGGGSGGSGGAGGSIGNNVDSEDPEFTDVIDNITVPAGRNVKLACSVKNLGSYKVAWMHFEQSAILTVHNHVITRNPRISVTHDKHDKHRTWFLHINNIQEEDKGRYMCQINTVTAKTQYGFVKVVVPPNIDDALTSSDVIVREGDNVTLRCKAKGSPEPSIRWRRDDGNKIVINKTMEVLEVDGEALELERISRLHMGAYLCIATNGVPPSVSKRIKVSVDFSPMVWIPHQLVGIPMYFNVTLECFIEANPTSLNYWTRENDQMITESAKYKTETLPGNPSYKATMRLTITNIQKSDYGSYKCVAKNPRGEMDGTIKLYMSSPPTTLPPPTTTTTRRTTIAPAWDSFSTPIYGMMPTNSVIVIDKMGTKYQSNLNEIGKSEQKLTGENPKGYDWSKDKSAAARMQLWLPHAACGNSNKLTYAQRICCNYAMLIALLGMLLTTWLQTAMIGTTIIMTATKTTAKEAVVAAIVDAASATAADSATNRKAVSASTTAITKETATTTATATPATVVLSAEAFKTIRKEFTTNEHTPLHMHNGTRSISVAYKQA